MAGDTGVAADRLLSLIERIERLEEDKAGVASDIKEVYAEAKSSGFDTKIMRDIVKLRTLDPSQRQEMDHLLEVYRRALSL